MIRGWLHVTSGMPGGDRKSSQKRFESAPRKSAYDEWLKDLKAKHPWQSGPTEVTDKTNNFSPTKINESSYTYLGCTDSDTITSKFDRQIVPATAYPLSLQVVNPIAGLPPPSDSILWGSSKGKLIDSHQKITVPYISIIDQILPLPQILSVVHSGEYFQISQIFQIFKYPNIQIFQLLNTEYQTPSLPQILLFIIPTITYFCFRNPRMVFTNHSTHYQCPCGHSLQA